MNQNLDPVSALVALLSILLGPTLANIIGPYAVILIASTLGASWALGRREPASRMSAVLFFARLNVLALLITVSLAQMARHFGLPVDPRYLLVPFAILIGGIGDDWPDVGRWLLNRIARLADRRIDGPDYQAPSGARTPPVDDVQAPADK